jgi:hypothetical protein
LAKFKYKVITSVVEDVYKENTKKDIYSELGTNIDFDKVTLVVEAENEEIATNTRKGITDIRMWELVNDLENDGL